LISEEGVVDDNKGGHTELRGDIQCTDCFASSGVERDNTIMGLREEKGIDDGKLDRSDGSCKLPVRCRGFGDIAGRGNGSEAVDSEVLGKVEMLFVLVIHLVSGNSVWVDEREGFNRECLLEGKFIRGFCNLVSIQC
jgi:hypothetical protein